MRAVVLSLPEASLWIAWGCVGGLLGVVYFAALRRTASQLAALVRWPLPLALTLGRFALAALVLGAAARTGAAPALAALCGFMLARTAIVRRLRNDT